MAIDSSGVGNISSSFQTGFNKISERSTELQTQMAAALSKDDLSQGDMLELQFQMGQYNATLEALSTVTKSMTDMLKSLAQRTG